ncbi:MAG: dynamin family protein [Planctomycetales bacterium]|nr:dynamin family protein [Planctomycetales bacterium]
MSIEDYKLIEHLHVAVRRSFDKAGLCDAPQGVRDNLEILLRKLGQIRAFENESSPRRIGIFGPPNRGKSTLLNELLGAKILTTSPIPMTRTVIEAHSVPQASLEAPWHVEVIDDDDFIRPFEHSSAEEVAATVQQYGSHRNGASEVRKIIVRSAFGESKLMKQNGILIDTPGAEVAFSQADGDRSEDTRRAVEMLKEVHVVLFCVRADQVGSESERAFYQHHMRLLDPINIVNFKDTSTDEPMLLRETVKNYGFKRDRIHLVSSRDAQKATNKKEKEASGVPSLEDAILRELARLTPHDGFFSCMNDFGSVLKNQAQANVDLLPEKVHLNRFIRAAESIGSRESEIAVERIKHIISSYQ